MTEHYYTSANQLVSLIKEKKLTATEVMEIHLNRIKATNEKVNAIVSLDEAAALEQAKQIDKRIAAGETKGKLLGLPIVVKDTHHAKGFPTTSGSEIFKDFIAEYDEISVSRLRQEGAIVIGKSNVPEFSAGAHTFNELFGVTRNPYNLNKTAGGSSGGAAAAVASGMVPLADGSDYGGSLRFPAAYNNVVGLRPSPGLVPIYEKKALYSPLLVHGPIARDVNDLALMLSVMAGYDSRSPISYEVSDDTFLNLSVETVKGMKIAWSSDLSGTLLLDEEVKETYEKQVQKFADLGCELVEDHPDLSNAQRIFETLRAFEFNLFYSDLLEEHEDKLRPSFAWNIRQGKKLTVEEIKEAEALRYELYHLVREFFEQYDALLLPVSQVSPFSVEYEYPEIIADQKIEHYIDWIRSCSDISVLGNPSLSIPGGFTKDKLPLGIQIVVPYKMDHRALQLGYAFEQLTQYGKKRPDFSS